MGGSVAVLAEQFGITPGAITNRSMRELWPTPARKRQREADARKAALAAVEVETPGIRPASALTRQSKQQGITPHSQGRHKVNTDSDDPEPLIATNLLEQLASICECPPQEFQSALARVLQAAIATGLAEIPKPRSIKDLATLVSLHSKTAGLDKVTAGAKDVPLVSPLRTVSRASAAVVMAEVVEPVPSVPEAVESVAMDEVFEV